MTNNSEINHSETNKLQTEPKIDVSKKVNSDKKNVKTIAEVDRKHAPLVPIKRPKAAQEIKLKKGKSKIQRYTTKLLMKEK